MLLVQSLWTGGGDRKCLLDSFLTIANSQPESIAIVDEGLEVTYGDLRRWAAEIADLLRKTGIEQGDRVAVTGTRSASVVAALFAAFGSGVTYVPLDTGYPARRLEHMLEDSAAKLLIHVGPRPDLATATPALMIPYLESAAAARSSSPNSWPQVACQANRELYVIYTSGSTGWPKGVAIQHSCLDNMVEWQRRHSVRPDLRTAQFAPLNFDVFFQETLGTLCGGGTLVIVPESLRQDPFELLAWLREQTIERLFLPYLALHMLAVAATEDRLDDLELLEVNTAGEQLVCTAPIRRFFERLPRCRLSNHYGQSESAMVTSYVLDGPPAEWPPLPPIGQPLPGCELLIDPVDPSVEEIGELLVAGRPLSLGYLNRPDLESERFVTIEATSRGHTRAFRTGDLVRLDGDVLYFLDRLDDEVKVRGVRINLREIDAWLLEQPAVREAVCVAVEAAEGTRHLRAAVVPERGRVEQTGQDLLSALAEVLPAVSVPVSVTFLDELPRGPSGKIDREETCRRILKFR